jgi:hypothetical protein
LARLNHAFTSELARLFGIQVRCLTSGKPKINSYALATEPQANYYLPQMFGQNHYQILTTPVELLKSLLLLFEKIRHQS